MPDRRKTLTRFMIEQEHRHPDSTGDFSALVNVLATATKIIANLVTRGVILRSLSSGDAAAPQRLDALGNIAMRHETEAAGHLAAILSEESTAVYPIPDTYRRGKYLLAFDPLDGSSNIDVNLPVGTVFSVLRRPDPPRATPPAETEFLQPGTAQVCAGFALYGPSTILVLTTGQGVNGFTLDHEIGSFVLTHPDMRIPARATGFAINAANERFWEQPVRRYVQECLDGAAGPRGRDFNMRWVASLVADTYHILTRGGVYLYPHDTRDPDRPSRVGLLYGANPIAFVVEQAGGAATTGRGRVMELEPTAVHQRVPLFFGSRDEVLRIENYHLDPAPSTVGFDTSIFRSRSLFRA